MSEENKTVQLKDKELESVTGGENEYPDSAGYQYNGYNVVDSDWGCPCKNEGHSPDFEVSGGFVCCHCKNYETLSSPINGWHGYCTWRKIK
ncbi:MAG: hypothetical protein MJ244_05475 [Clostridia bacterium]|nr:hypothetical protein [Clostridia bacterium]